MDSPRRRTVASRYTMATAPSAPAKLAAGTLLALAFAALTHLVFRRIERRVGQISVPLSYADELYTARSHVAMVRQRLLEPGFGYLRVSSFQTHSTEEEVRQARLAAGVRPVYKRVDTCAAEFATDTAYIHNNTGQKLRILAVSIVPKTSVATHASNYITTSIKKGSDTIAAHTTNSSGGSALTAGTVKDLSLTGTGKIKRRRANHSHNLTKKNAKRKRHLRQDDMIHPSDEKAMKKLLGM